MAEVIETASPIDLEGNTITKCHSQVVEIIGGIGDIITITQPESIEGEITETLPEVAVPASEDAADTSAAIPDFQETVAEDDFEDDANIGELALEEGVNVDEGTTVLDADAEGTVDASETSNEVDSSTAVRVSQNVVPPAEPDTMNTTSAEHHEDTATANDTGNTTLEPLPDTRVLGCDFAQVFDNEENTSIITPDVSAAATDTNISTSCPVDHEDQDAEKDSTADLQTQPAVEEKSKEAPVAIQDVNVAQQEETAASEAPSSSTNTEEQVEAPVPGEEKAVMPAAPAPMIKECQVNGENAGEPQLPIHDTGVKGEKLEETDTALEELQNESQDENDETSWDGTQQEYGSQDSQSMSPVPSSQSSGDISSVGKKPDINKHNYSKYNTVSYRKIRKGNTKQKIDEFESMMHV
ncbi:dentin sialophosphoprotein isoform X2 [Amia ocellicauda]|uniref:dentin sialophosphoprotein isoform X2 n=1 Tax=Amia ocellicauda TaxID=2972642 RepID=UPI00346465D9